MSLYEGLVKKEEKLSLVGLGYVGMPIAVAFAKKIKVIGFDLNAKKIELYKSGIDPTREVGDEEVRKTSVEFTADETKLKEAKFHIVAVPTPVNEDHTPDLTPVEGASRILGRNLTRGSVVVFESTVYPGVTEDVCVNYPESDRIQYKETLQLTESEFSEFCCLISELFDKRMMSPDVRFIRIEDAIKVYKYLKNTDSYRLLGLFTSSEIFDEFEEEGTFSVFKAGEATSNPCIFLGCDILGCENGGNGAFYFDCYLVNALNEEIAKHPNSRYRVNSETGLIMNSFA